MQCWLHTSGDKVLSAQSPQANLHWVGRLWFMSLTYTNRACPLAWSFFLLFPCLFLCLWPFQLYLIPQILPTTLRFLTLFFQSYFCRIGSFNYIHLFMIVSFSCPHGFTFTSWGCCGLRFSRKPTELAHSFSFCSCVYFCLYGPFNCISFFKFSKQLSVFSPCSSGLITTLFVLSTIYLFMKVSFSPDMIPSG